jgi:hypothetical protein
LNGTHQFLVYADDVNIMAVSVHTTNEKSEALIVSSKMTELELNADKTRYMVFSRNQNVVRSHIANTDNNSFESVEQYKYLGKRELIRILSGRNRSRLKLGNACYHSV